MDSDMSITEVLGDSPETVAELRKKLSKAREYAFHTDNTSLFETIGGMLDVLDITVILGKKGKW